jgi:hypothetical protein
MQQQHQQQQQEADSPQVLRLAAFEATLYEQDLAGMTVQVPTEL